jgi:outer membrane protein assembly factor BamA
LDAETVLKYYNDEPDADARVSYDAVNTSDTQVKVIFDIDEAQKSRIGTIEFIGNDGVKESELLKAMPIKK